MYCCTLDRKKYKTLKGLEKHYNANHVKNVDIRNFQHYKDSFVNVDGPPKVCDCSSDEGLKSRVNILEKQIKDLMGDSDRKVQSNPLECLICWDKESNFALIPCGHKVLCGDCAIVVLSGSKLCPVCQMGVYDMLRIFDGGIAEI